MSQRLRPLIEPAAGVVFLLLWIQAEIGRLHSPGFWTGLALYAVALAISRILTPAALILVVVIPLLQLAGLLSAPESTTWPVWFAALAVAYAAGGSARTAVRWAGLAAGILSVGALAVVLVAVGDWRSWTGAVTLDLAGGPSGLQYVVFLAATGYFLWCAAWALGFGRQLSARRRIERELLHDAERERAEADAERRSEQERGAIAREVHDVLAHSLAVVTAVADGTRYLRDAKPEATEARTDDAPARSPAPPVRRSSTSGVCSRGSATARTTSKASTRTARGPLWPT